MKTKLQDDIQMVFEVLKERLPDRNELDNLELATAIGNRLNGRKVFYINVSEMPKKNAKKYVMELLKKWEKPEITEKYCFNCLSSGILGIQEPCKSCHNASNWKPSLKNGRKEKS